MMTGLLDKGHHVITDNWYTSLRLARYMLTRKTDLTGVVRVNRGIPERLKNEILDSKQSSFMRNNDVLAVKYEDRKPVYSLSTRYTAEVIEKTKPFQKKVYFKLPVQIFFYNEYMGSVDRADQLLKPYAYGRKNLAWFKKLGIHFIERMLLNSYLVYKSQHSDYKKDFMDYIQEVIKGLIKEFSPGGKEIICVHERANPPRRRRAAAQADVPEPVVPEADEAGEPNEPEGEDVEEADHPWKYHQRVQKERTTKTYPQAKCVQCRYEGKGRTDTRMICILCPKKPGLCSPECFERFHYRIYGEPIYGEPQLRSPPVAARLPHQGSRRPDQPEPVIQPIERPVPVVPSKDPVEPQRKGAKRKRTQHTTPSSNPSSTLVEAQPASPLQDFTLVPGTSTFVDPQPGSSSDLATLQPVIPVARVVPVRKKTKKDSPKPSGSNAARRYADGTYEGLTDSENEDGNNRELGFEEF